MDTFRITWKTRDIVYIILGHSVYDLIICLNIHLQKTDTTANGHEQFVIF
jgi:hypothetical protein